MKKTSDFIYKIANKIFQFNFFIQFKGYICQDIAPGVLERQSNRILTAIVFGMRKMEPSNHVKLAATNALYNSLEFIKANFVKQMVERNHIMEVVCDSTQSPNIHVAVAALQCLVKISNLYYDYIEPYMAQAILPITLKAMKSKNDFVALQAIQFWSRISECESIFPHHFSKCYVHGGLKYLLPTLLNNMAKQAKYNDDYGWNPSKAANICLMFFSSCCKEEMVQLFKEEMVLPFVEKNIKSANWYFRNAALMAFRLTLGYIQEAALKTFVRENIPFFALNRDESVIVRNAASLVCSEIVRIFPTALNSVCY